MYIKKSLLVLLIVSISLAGCHNSSKLEAEEAKDLAVSVNTDSIELTSLVREMYEWHEAKPIDDFPYKYKNQVDSIFNGIDWEEYNKNIEDFRKTGFFTESFLLNHKAIASGIDSSIQNADIALRNIRDGIPIWQTGADDWCDCQDYPDNYWELITIDSLHIENNIASFYWTWDKERSPEQHKVKMTAAKSGNKWRVNSLGGFENFRTVADYNKVIKK